MPLALFAKRRLKKDIKELLTNEEEMAKTGIHTFVDENDITNIYALIIGTEGTPYEGGFYFFLITIPDDYPIKPPKITFLSTASGVRIHPNLYTEGKVCLSIVNTWDGDGWSASYSVRTMLMVIQCYVFVKYPLHNEPGYEKETESVGGTVDLYSRYVTYQNIRVCVNDMLEHLSTKLAPFRSVMNNHLRSHAQKYFKRIQELEKERQSLIVTCPAYSHASQCITDYKAQYNRFVKYCATLGIVPDKLMKPDTDKVSIKIKKKAKAKTKIKAKTKTGEV